MSNGRQNDAARIANAMNVTIVGKEGRELAKIPQIPDIPKIMPHHIPAPVLDIPPYSVAISDNPIASLTIPRRDMVS